MSSRGFGGSPWKEGAPPAHIDAKPSRNGERSDLATEQSLNNSLPNRNNSRFSSELPARRTRMYNYLRDALSRNRSKRLGDFGCDEWQSQLCRPQLQEVHLLLAVSLFVVLLALVDVRVSPREQSIHQPGELVGHGGD